MAQVLTLIAMVVVGRILDRVEYGEIGIIQNTIGMLGVFAGFGIGLTATKHVAEYKDTEAKRTLAIIDLVQLVTGLFGVIVSSALILFSEYISIELLSAPHLINEIRLSSALVLLNALIGCQYGVLAGFEDFKGIAISSVLRGFVSFPALIIGSCFFGVQGVVVGLILSTAFAFIVTIGIVRKHTVALGARVEIEDVWRERSLLWRFSAPAFLAGVVATPVRWGASALIVAQPNGYTEFGVVVAATQFQSAINFLGAKVGAVMLPILSLSNYKKRQDLGNINMLISWLIGLVPAVPAILFPEIFSLIFGAQYAGHSAEGVFVIVMLYTVIIMYQQGITRVLVSKNLIWIGVLMNGLWGLLVILFIVQLKELGAIGYAVSVFLAYFLTTLCFIPWLVNRQLVPSGTLVSFEATLIWVVLLGCSLVSFLGAPISTRIFMLVFSAVVIFLSIRNIYMKRFSLEP